MKGIFPSNAKEMVLCALFAALIAVGAFLKIPIPVVPFTLQFLFTNLAALILGKRLGTAACLLYLFVGLIGVPVFVSGGGPAYIFNPTFGYLVGFAAGTWLAGTFMESSQVSFFARALIAGFINITVVYALGMVYFYFITNYVSGSPIGIWNLFLYCFLITVPGDIALCFASAALVYKLRFSLKGLAV